MKLNVTAELNGAELLNEALKQLKSNNIDADVKDLKILVKSKDGKEVDLSPDRIRITYEKVSV